MAVSGTANRVVKFTSATTIGNTEFPIIDNNTAVFFGTNGATYSANKSLIFSPVSFTGATGESQVQDFVLIGSGSVKGVAYNLTTDGLAATTTNRPRISANSVYVGFEANIVTVSAVSSGIQWYEHWQIKGSLFKNSAGTNQPVQQTKTIFATNSPIKILTTTLPLTNPIIGFPTGNVVSITNLFNNNASVSNVTSFRTVCYFRMYTVKI